MKKIFTFLFSFFIIYNAQAQNTFEKIIDTLGSGYASCVQETFDGGYILCGGSIYGGNDAIVEKLDSTGTIEWAKIYSGPGVEGGVYIKQTPDSGYILNGIYDSGLYTKNWLLRLNAYGDTLWTKTYSLGSGATDAFQMAVNGSNNYGLTGYFHSPTKHPDAFLTITNDSGAVLASNIYYTPLNSFSYAITNSNNNYLLTGQIVATSTIFPLYLLMTDSIGDTLWTRQYGNGKAIGFAVEHTVDSGFIAAGFIWNGNFFKENVYMVKTTSNGDTIWTKQFGGSTGCSAISIQQTKDGGYIITGRIINGTPLSSDVYLVKTDSMGDTLWTRQFGYGSEDDGYFVRQTRDGGYIIGGKGATAAGQGGIYLIKTDSLGLVATSTGTAELNNPFVFSVYPNPSTGIFTVRAKGLPKSYAKVEIYNLYNQRIYYCQVNNNSTLQVDLSAMPGGIYAVMLKTKETVFSKKIVIQK